MITVPFSRGSQSLMVCMCALPRLTVTFSSLPRRDVWTSVFGNATKMKTGAVYLVNNKHSAGFTPDLCTCLRASLPPPLPSPLPSPFSGVLDVLVLSYLFQIRPSVSALIARR